MTAVRECVMKYNRHRRDPALTPRGKYSFDLPVGSKLIGGTLTSRRLVYYSMSRKVKVVFVLSYLL
jgi:hypothetical protein